MPGKEVKTFILSPCGTSLLTNWCDDKTRSLVFAHANALEPVGGQEGEKLRAHVEKRRRLFTSMNHTDAAQLSAEINGLFHLYGGDFSKGTKDVHVLLATDTWLGKETARMVGDWLKEQEIKHVEVWNDIGGLRTDSLENFHTAVSDLAKRLAEVVPGYKEKGYKITFNLTGGFKSIQGVLQTFSQFYADEAVYIFETSKELLHIPRIPVSLDAQRNVIEHLKTWRRLSLGLPVNPHECEGISDAFYFEIDGEVSLSPWGELVWQQCWKRLYEDWLIPPSDAISWTEKFEKAVTKLPPDRLFEINKRMGDLALHLERQDHPNPNSLCCHPLKGKPVPGCTHEIYAWSDKDAKRIYGRCYGHSRFEIENIDLHL